MTPLVLAVAVVAAGVLAAEPPQEAFPFEGGRFVVTRAEDGTCVIAMQGVVTRDAVLKFDMAVARAAELRCDLPWLLLESPGGGLVDGIDLGRAVREQKLRTITRYDCFSACALIFLGGTERWLAGSRARIGLHQAGQTYRDKQRACASTLQTHAARTIRRYLHWVVPATAEAVMDTLMQSSCTTMEYVQGERAVALGIATRLERPDQDLFGPPQHRSAREKRDSRGE